MITKQGTSRLIAKLSLLPFFPAEDRQRAALAELIDEFASDDAQLDWLAKRMMKLYKQWPGPYEMRACFCSKFKPKDGINAWSDVYADGIPSEKPAPSFTPAALPPGHAVSADPELDRKIREAAEVKRIPPASSRKRL